MALEVSTLISFCLGIVGLVTATLCALFVLARRADATEISHRLKGKETVGFFHPYAHAGGGGERVLWCAINAILQRHPGVVCVVYTGDTDVSKPQFLQLAKDRFGVEVKPDLVEFVHLSGRWWVEASTWKRLTLLGQAFGSIMLAWEAICKFRPDIYIDSMGYAFTFPVFSLLGGCRMGCYVHYPTISTDMLARVQRREVGVCNDDMIVNSGILSFGKLLYYKAFAWVYGVVGRYAEVVLVNSSWTGGHIRALWNMPSQTHVVFPPCDTRTLTSLPLERKDPPGGGFWVLSLAQFRPEKDHPLQLKALAKLYEIAPERRVSGEGRLRLILAGGCRDAGDRSRVANLQRLAKELGLREREKESDSSEDWDIDFRTNISMDEMKTLIGTATIGLHTMREEHFGINVVEFMAAGAIALAHKSGGPKMDIVTPLDGQRTGFLADDEVSYSEAIKEILSLSAEERTRIAAAGRESVRDRFSQVVFEAAVADKLIAPLRKGNL